MSKKRRRDNDYSRRSSKAGERARRRPLGVKLPTAGLVQLWAGVILVGVVLGGWLLGFVTPMDADRGVGLWSAAMFSDCPQPECDDFYAANVSGP